MILLDQVPYVHKTKVLFVIFVGFMVFFFVGRVPTLQEGNMMESIFNFPWSKERPVVLGMHHVDKVPALPLI